MNPELRYVDGRNGHSPKASEALVLSHKQPYTHWHGPEAIECARPKGVLARHFDHLLKTQGGLWIAASSGNADRLVCDTENEVQVPPQHGLYTLKRIFLEQQKERLFYYGFCCGGIWSLFHTPNDPEHLGPEEFLPYEPVFQPNHWQAYQEINRAFALAAAEEAEELAPTIWVLEHPLALVPRLLRDQGLNTTRMMAVWTIPWPAWSIVKQCPWIQAVTLGLLACDAIHFGSRAAIEGFVQTATQFGALVQGGEPNLLSHQGRVIRLALFHPQLPAPPKPQPKPAPTQEFRGVYRTYGQKAHH